MAGRNTTALGFGIGAALVGLLLVFGALGPVSEDRDSDGYYMSDEFTVDRPSHAVVAGDVDLLRGRYETVVESSIVLAVMSDPDDLRMQGVASESGALFMGIAASSAVEDYLAGVAHDEITGWDLDLASIRDIEYTPSDGTGPPADPGAQSFWAVSSEGTGLQTLDWTIESGDWTAVIMNADASSPVTAELSFGAAPSDAVLVIAWVSLVLGLVALAGGGVLLYLGFRRRNGAPPPPTDLGSQGNSNG